MKVTENRLDTLIDNLNTLICEDSLLTRQERETLVLAVAAIGAMNSEMKSGKWVWAGIGLQLCTGYTVAYLVYTIGTLVTAPSTLNVGAAVAGLIAVLIMAAVIVCMVHRTNRKIKEDYALAGNQAAMSR